MAACSWRQPGTCQSVGTAFYCRGKEEGHEGPHQVEVLSPSNVHADVLRAFVEELAAQECCKCCRTGCGSCDAVLAIRDAEAAAQAAREGRY